MVDVRKICTDTAPQVISWRRQIHANPELAFKEYKTSSLVESVLREAGVEVVRFPNSTAVLGVIRGGKPGKTIALRADMDALPLEELAEVDFKSLVPGVMHACGHDVHTAILMGTAKILAAHKAEIPGTIKLFFQPAEEYPPGGAIGMIENGVMEGVDHVFGLHVGTDTPSGTIGLTYGYSSANSDRVDIKVIGRGGHGANPQDTVDAVVVACHVVVALQTVVSRNIGALDSAVVTVGTIHAGTVNNIIAETAEMKLTVRTLKPEIREKVKERIEGIVKGVTQAMNANYECVFSYGYPSLPNAEPVVDFVKQIAEGVVGAENVKIKNIPGMGGEDFAYFAQKAPSAFFRLGAKPVEGEVFPGHNPKFHIDENCVKTGLEMMVNIALKCGE